MVEYELQDDLNEKLMKIISYKKIGQNELQEHLNLIKKWLKDYNQFEYDNQSIGKFTKYIKKVEEIKIVLNHKLNFCRVKLFIDFLELKIKCPSFSNEFRINFIQYISYVNALVRRILISSKKILEDTSVFNDLILFNFPYNYSYNYTNNNNNYYELLKSNRGIISFSKCFVIKVNSPIFLLWGKKEYPSCSCESESKNFSNKKYFNIYTQNLKYNSNFSRPSICRKCGKLFYHDTKGDIYIQSQAIKLVIDCNNSLLPNVISAWAFGDLINSVQEGDCITLNAFHVPEKINVFEKNYTNGYFVALNYDKFFNNLYLLRPADFKLNSNNAQDNLAEKLKDIKLKENTNNNCNFDDNIFIGENVENLFMNLDPINSYNLKVEFLSFIIHAADISNPTKPLPIYKEWAQRCVDEFFKQGDLEKKMGMPISFNCDRNTVSLPQSQLGFMDVIVSPLFNVLNEYFPQLSFTLENLKENYNYYKNIEEKKDNRNKNK